VLRSPDVRTPAWYADPTQRHQYRWWDGDRWTDQVADGDRQGFDHLPPGNPPRKKRTKWPWIVAAVFVLGVAGCFAAFHQAVEDLKSHAHRVGTVATDAGTTPPPRPKDAFTVGDVVSDGDWRLAVRGVQSPFVPQSSFVHAQPGMRYLALHLDATNTSRKVQDFPEFTLHIEDPAGHRFVEGFVGTTGAPDLQTRNLDPGASTSGTLYFEVPDAASHLTLVFWPSPLADQARISLT
jgi:hypothetical protein